ncbi:hypothetical protein M1M96_01670 [Peptococcaceae bacterium]|nr:hypothetical protein [Peptococcaceae bacterium]
MALCHSIRDINIATEQRIALRNKWGNPPISPTFKDILAMLESSLTTFNTLNKLLYKAVFEENTDKPVYIDNIFWEKLSGYIDKRHNNLTGADFIHAFMYVAMAANNIKIVCREAKSFLNELTTEENDKSDKL